MEFKSRKAVQVIAKVFSILAFLAFIFSIIGAVGCLIGGIAILSLGSLLTEEALAQITEISGVSDMRGLGVSLLAEVVFLVGGLVVIYFVRRYLKNELQAGTPFTYSGASELLRLGVINLTVPLGSLIISLIITAACGCENVISNEYNAIGGVFMILLSFVFKYGAELESRVLSTSAPHGADKEENGGKNDLNTPKYI